MKRLQKIAFAGKNDTALVPAAPCDPQSPFRPLGDPSAPATSYQHTLRQKP